MLEIQTALIHPHFLATPYARPTIKVVSDNALNPAAKVAVMDGLSGLVSSVMATYILPRWEVHRLICATDAHGYVWLERAIDKSDESCPTDVEGMEILRHVCAAYQTMARDPASFWPKVTLAVTP
jgi:hypothetical protein